MKLSLFVILFFLCNTLFAQENILKEETLDVLRSVLFIKEVNPIEKEESDFVNEVLDLAMKHYANNGKKNNSLIMKAFARLDDNSRSYYDDAPDERRMKTRRALSFVAIALSSEAESRLTYIEYSKCSIIGHADDFEVEMLAHTFLGISFLELLFKHEGQQLARQDVEKVQYFLSAQSNNLSSHLKEKSFNLLKLFLAETN